MTDIKRLYFEDLDLMLPLIQELMGHKLEDDLLRHRFSEMFQQNYESFGIYDGDELIGIFGLWFRTRHYAGKSCEQDHVYILPEKRSKGLGREIFQWIFNYCQDRDIETYELNAYVTNYPSHKFYMNLGYEILGYHFVKRFS